MNDEKDRQGKGEGTKSEDFEKIEKPEKIPLIDTAKRLFSVGVSAAFMTEESIRAALADLKLPKDVLQFILNSANKGKEELVQRVGKEIGSLINHIDLVKEVSRFAETHKFKISAEVEITPKKAHEKNHGQEKNGAFESPGDDDHSKPK